MILLYENMKASAVYIFYKTTVDDVPPRAKGKRLAFFATVPLTLIDVAPWQKARGDTIDYLPGCGVIDAAPPPMMLPPWPRGKSELFA